MTSGAAPTLAIIVPVLVEPDLDRHLGRVCALTPPDELIVVAARGATTSEQLAAFRAERVISGNVQILSSGPGRARQMNAGAATARSDILLFLHADTVPPPGALALVRDAVGRGAVWGRFDVRLSGAKTAFRVIERFMNWRSALTGIVTGDQALFVRRDAFEALGGFATVELMEDIELSGRLKRLARPFRIRAAVTTSSRRWEQNGIARTVVRMWLLRGLYAVGVSPRRLAQWYK